METLEIDKSVVNTTYKKIVWHDIKLKDPPFGKMIWFKTDKAEYYGIYTYLSHGNETRNLPNFINGINGSIVKTKEIIFWGEIIEED